MRERSGIGVMQVPDEAVHAGLSRRSLGTTAAKRGEGGFLLRHSGFLGRVFRGLARISVDELARGIQELKRQITLRPFFQPILDDSAVRRILADGREASQPASASASPFGADGRFRFEQTHVLRRGRVPYLIQKREIVHDPERAALRGHDQLIVALVKRQVGDGHHGKVELDRLPVVTGIVGDINPEFRSGEEKTLAVRILTHHAGEVVTGNAVDDFRPALTEVGGLIEVRPEVIGLVHRRGDVRRSGIVRRRVDGVDLDPLRHDVLGRRHVGPGLAAVPGQVHQAVIRADPDQSLRDRRLIDRKDRVVILDTGVVLRDRPAGGSLLGFVIARQIL